MAGFFGLFGSKSKYVDEVTEQDRQSTQKGEAYYLKADEAKSLGNVEYMRQPKTIKRTFPKTLSSQGGESVQQISATEKMKINAALIASNGSNSNGTKSATPEIQPQAERRSVDGSMDMFRKMAREMKK
jgi:hypothetical protein